MIIVDFKDLWRILFSFCITSYAVPPNIWSG